jgi:hypothetical protein
MIARAALGALALLGVQASQQAPAPGTISFSYSFWGHDTRFTVDRDGVVLVERQFPPGPDPADPSRAQERHRLETGPRGYDRMVALLTPVRRWAGGTAPCTASTDNMFQGLSPEPVWSAPLATIRWQDGAEVKLDMGCMAGPAHNEIELVRVALDEVGRWVSESRGQDAPFDGGANAAAVEIPEGED